MTKKLLLGAYGSLLILFTIFSYSLTAPNLILTNWEPYWDFQTWMWATFFNDRPLLTYTYAGLLVAVIISYLALAWYLHRRKESLPWWQYALLAAPLLLANNALSYDVFNYIFNAKMVMVYQADPHVKVALDYYYDDWTRFMHNTHTPAPYGYGWTIFSLLPYSLGLGKFLLTWLVFRGWSMLSLGLLWLAWRYLASRMPRVKAAEPWLWLNPLLLIETIANSHNDLWMMVPALLALGLVLKLKTERGAMIRVVTAVLLLAFSISIKFASLALVPLWGWLMVDQFMPATFFKSARTWLRHHWPLLASLLLFVPLLTSRSQQFHPWYLTWSLVWLPALQSDKYRTHRWWATFLVITSFTSLARYIPYLWAGEHSAQTLLQQKMITWSAVGWTIVVLLIKGVAQRRRVLT